MIPGRDDSPSSFDPFDEFEDRPEDELGDSDRSELTPHARRREDEARAQLEVMMSPGFQEALRQFRLDDPSSLIRRNARRLRQRAYVLDPSRLMMGTLVRVALYRHAYDGKRKKTVWVGSRIDETIRDLLTQDIEDEQALHPIVEPLQSHYAFLVNALQIGPRFARRACILMNMLPEPVRKITFEVICMLEPKADLAAQGLGSPAEVDERLRAGLQRLADGGIGFRLESLKRDLEHPLDLRGGVDA